MAVYNTGSVKLTVSSTKVIGANTLFLTYAAAGNIFKVSSEQVTYQIGAVNSATRITLTASYVNANYNSGDVLNGIPYQIVRNYTVNRRYPEIATTDQNFSYLVTKTFRMIDSDIYNASMHSISVTNATITNASIGKALILNASIRNATFAKAKIINADIVAASITSATILNMRLRGNIRYRPIPKKASYTATNTDNMIVIGGNSASLRVKLFYAGTKSKGKEIKVLNNSAYLVNVGVQGSDTVEGNTLIQLLNRYESVHLLVATSNLFVEF